MAKQWPPWILVGNEDGDFKYLHIKWDKSEDQYSISVGTDMKLLFYP